MDDIFTWEMAYRCVFVRCLDLKIGPNVKLEDDRIRTIALRIAEHRKAILDLQNVIRDNVSHDFIKKMEEIV